MLNRSDIKKLLKNVDKVSHKTLIDKAKKLGLEIKSSISDSKLRKQIKKEGEKQIDAYMDNVLKRQRLDIKHTRERVNYRYNTQGVKIRKEDYRQIMSLEDEFNNKKERILNNYIKKREKEGTPLTQIEIEFLKGKSVRHTNSSENINLNINFRKENLIDSITNGVDIKYYKEMIKDEIKNFKITSVIKNRSRKLNSYLKTWVNSGDLTPNRQNEILDMYKNMNMINKSQFNKDLERKMQQVESIVKNPRSSYDVYNALKEIALMQNDRDFIAS